MEDQETVKEQAYEKYRRAVAAAERQRTVTLREAWDNYYRAMRRIEAAYREATKTPEKEVTA